MANKISPLAYVDPEAKIGENCEIGPFCFIDKNVVIGDNNRLMNSVTVLYGTRIQFVKMLPSIAEQLRRARQW